LDKTFEKFFTTKANMNGTGLGLSIVSKVIEDHGAQIKMKSDEHYTSFLVTFTLI
jgi:signal transduction histidine kinase